MKNVISYVLFGATTDHHTMIPYALIANSAIYPTFNQRFYVHKDSMGSGGAQVLKQISERYPTVEMVVVDAPYQDKQPNTWRMRPLWEPDVDILLCRDLDHITKRIEREAVEHFLYHIDYLAQGIRSYHLHTTPYMAGLCGFRCGQVRYRVQPLASTFEAYLEWGRCHSSYCSDWRWGCDQALLRDFFGTAGLYPQTADYPQFTAPLSVHSFNAQMVPPNLYQGIPVSCSMEALNYSDSISPGFTGQACLASANQMRELARIAGTNMAADVAELLWS
jgi:hypothetical protein